MEKDKLTRWYKETVLTETQKQQIIKRKIERSLQVLRKQSDERFDNELRSA